MRSLGPVLLFAAALTMCSGCGGHAKGLPELGQVTGTVTLDGQPLAGARVRFEPQVAAAMSNGLTDASGEYELWYTSDVKGAAVGSHLVRIETPPNPDPASGAMPVMLPAKYNTDSTLTADVKAGKNALNFELTSQ